MCRTTWSSGTSSRSEISIIRSSRLSISCSSTSSIAISPDRLRNVTGTLTRSSREMWWIIFEAVTRRRTRHKIWVKRQDSADFPICGVWMKVLTLTAWLAAAGSAAAAQGYEIQPPTEAVPCAASFDTKPRLQIALQPSDDGWQVSLTVTDNILGFGQYFEKSGILDLDRFRQESTKIVVGKAEVRTNRAFATDLSRDDLDAGTQGIAIISAQHYVAKFIGFVDSGRIIMGSWADVWPSTEGAGKFAACAAAATGYSPDNMPDRDLRAELLEDFEAIFKRWAEASARLDACAFTKTRQDQDEVIAEAASAFFPGMMGYLDRKEWVSSMELPKSIANLAGTTDAMTDGCFGAELLEAASRAVVDRAIEVARDLD